MINGGLMILSKWTSASFLLSCLKGLPNWLDNMAGLLSFCSPSLLL